MRKSTFLQIAVLALAFLAGTSCKGDKENENVDHTYKVGDLYNSEEVKGIVYKITDPKGLHGLIVSLDETKVQWATQEAESVATQATDDTDGRENMETIMALKDWKLNYPAFAWCDAKNTAGGSGWVLPAYFQLLDLYNTYLADPAFLNKCLSDNGGTPIIVTSTDDQDYWSSTEESTNFALSFEFYQGADDFPFKTETARVRAVRVF